MIRGRCELGALPKTKFDMLVVPSPENEDVEAVWTAPWAYYSWAYYCQLLLRRARRLWRLHISEEWLTVRLANMLAIADPDFDPTNPVAMVRHFVNPVLANVARDRWVTLVRQLVSPVPANPCLRTPLGTSLMIC